MIPTDPLDAADYWFVRLHSGACSAEERVAFGTWLTQAPAHKEAFASVEALWSEMDGLDRPTRQAPRQPYWRAAPLNWGMAAVFILVLAVFIGWNAIDVPAIDEFKTAALEQRNLVLPDGSKVAINVGSSLRTEYSAKRRRVVLLRGQAQFDVAADTRPFSVSVEDTVIRDIGTRFDVRLDGEGRFQVAVAEGRVRLEPPRGGSIDVPAGQRVAVRQGGVGPLEAADPTEVGAWSRGRMVFRDTSLADVAGEIARYHRIQVGFADEDAARLRISGSFEIADPQGLLAALPNILPIAVTRRDGEYILRTRNKISAALR